MDPITGGSTYYGGTAIENPYSSAATSQNSNSGELTIEDFYSLLAAQLKYQDADNPMDTSEMMAQMVQTQMITALTSMEDAIMQMSQINTISYSTSMVGKTVTVAEVDVFGYATGEETTGTVTGVLMGDQPYIFIDGKAYAVSQIMTVGEIPEDAIEDLFGDGTEGETSTENDTETP